MRGNDGILTSFFGFRLVGFYYPMHTSHRKLRLEERYSEAEELESVRRRLEHLPSKMSRLRLKMVLTKYLAAQNQIVLKYTIDNSAIV